MQYEKRRAGPYIVNRAGIHIHLHTHMCTYTCKYSMRRGGLYAADQASIALVHIL